MSVSASKGVIGRSGLRTYRGPQRTRCVRLSHPTGFPSTYLTVRSHGPPASLGERVMFHRGTRSCEMEISQRPRAARCGVQKVQSSAPPNIDLSMTSFQNLISAWPCASSSHCRSHVLATKVAFNWMLIIATTEAVMLRGSHTPKCLPTSGSTRLSMGVTQPCACCTHGTMKWRMQTKSASRPNGTLTHQKKGQTHARSCPETRSPHVVAITWVHSTSARARAHHSAGPTQLFIGMGCGICSVPLTNSGSLKKSFATRGS
mmetsp:Transcript_90766/g.253486  ORF Transcript_90766/g.253486 Transcript_90766/m.253486 type:complete len:260 (-) Transcript_90766:950-1729(-)